MSTLNNVQAKSKSWGELWSRHRGLIVTALSLGFIILAWYSGKYDRTEFEVPFYLLAYVIGGYQKAWEGLQTLIREKDLDVDLLMVVAAIGAASIGFWRDGAILILIFSLSGALEGYTMERTNNEIEAIMKLRPEEAIVLQGNTLAGTIPSTTASSIPNIDFLALYPSWQSAIPQIAIVISALFVIFWKRLTAKKR